MNRFSARLAAAMLLVAFLALLVMGSALIAAFQDAERRVAQLPPPAAAHRPFPAGGRHPAPPADLSPHELTRYQARVGRAVFQDIASSAGRGAVVGAGVAVLAAALLSALLAGSLARPLRGVSEAARQVARGDLAARAPPPGRGD
ncbi:MAG: HAMP domain-containing protein, partial [Deinococcus sp.]